MFFCKGCSFFRKLRMRSGKDEHYSNLSVWFVLDGVLCSSRGVERGLSEPFSQYKQDKENHFDQYFIDGKFNKSFWIAPESFSKLFKFLQSHGIEIAFITHGDWSKVKFIKKFNSKFSEKGVNNLEIDMVRFLNRRDIDMLQSHRNHISPSHRTQSGDLEEASTLGIKFNFLKNTLRLTDFLLVDDEPYFQHPPECQSERLMENFVLFPSKQQHNVDDSQLIDADHVDDGKSCPDPVVTVFDQIYKKLQCHMDKCGESCSRTSEVHALS